MRQSNIDKIQKALKLLGTQPFTIAELCKQSKISDPTVRNYLKSNENFKINEVSYGKYQVIETQNTSLNRPNQPLETTKTLTENTMKKNETKSDVTNKCVKEEPTIQIHGEVYLNAYLKGFDRGFELGLKKALELNKSVPENL